MNEFLLFLDFQCICCFIEFIKKHLFSIGFYQGLVIVYIKCNVKKVMRSLLNYSCNAYNQLVLLAKSFYTVVCGELSLLVCLFVCLFVLGLEHKCYFCLKAISAFHNSSVDLYLIFEKSSCKNQVRLSNWIFTL